ncbi:MAG: DUF983 domain-containing protein [Rhodospirillales bacterium]
MTQDLRGGDWPPLSPLKTGLRQRCPRCGQGRLFKGFLTMVDNCAVCGLSLRAHDSGDGPAVFIIFILGFIVMPSALWVEFRLEPPFWVHLLIWPALLLGGTIGLLRPLKGFMVALQYRHRSTESDLDQ